MCGAVRANVRGQEGDMRIVSLGWTVVTVVMVGMLGAAAAQTPPVINACVKNDDGNMRFVVTGVCKANETLLSWNQTGPIGPAGPQGLQGAPGQSGPQGPEGLPGPGLAFVAQNGATLYSAGFTEAGGDSPKGIGLIPVNDQGEMAGVGVEAYSEEGSTTILYRFVVEHVTVFYEGANCEGRRYILGKKYYGASRPSGLDRWGASLLVASEAPTGVTFNSRSVGSGCSTDPGGVFANLVEYSIHLPTAYPWPLKARGL
jgi:hypothetical protein